MRNSRLVVAAAVVLGALLATRSQAAEGKPDEAAKAARAAKQAAELIDGASQAGWLNGVRAIELIRGDIVSVTLDAGITGAIVPTMYVADSVVATHEAALEKYADPEAFTVSSATDPDYKTPVRPNAVGQYTYEGRNSTQRSKSLPACTIFHTECFLFLPKPMKSGHRYAVEVRPRGSQDSRLSYSATLAYDAATTTTKVIKLNQVAYSSLAKQRYAYLGWWAGNRGKVDYASFKNFEVVDEKTGKSVHRGEIMLRAEQEKYCGEDVYEMDLSALSAGRYHIRIANLGRSEAFEVGGGGIHALYYHTMRAFFHQRCGQEFKPPWTWAVKPACHSEILASGFMPAGSPLVIREPAGGNMPQTAAPAAGEKPRHFRGGYHDAADFDVFTQHLLAASELITLSEIFPKAFADGDLDLPESGNGVPDILDEAEWGLSGFLALQYENGAVPLGRGNLQDGIRQNIENGYDTWHKDGRIPPYGILPPKGESTPTFAAVAVQFARIIRPYDAGKADRYLAAAEKAFAYSSTHSPDEIEEVYSTPEYKIKSEKTSLDAWYGCNAWAAAELLRATGRKEFAEYLESHEKYLSLMNHRYSAQRGWAIVHAEGVKPALRDRLRKEFLRDNAVNVTERNPYRMGFAYWDKNCGWWGSMQGINASDRLVRAFALSQDQKYLDALCFNADWHLGCNPRSETFITNMGYRFPRRPEISWFLYEKPMEDLGGKTIRGISVYGLGPAWADWFGRWPAHRSRRDVWGDHAEVYNEFTVSQTLTPAAFAYGTLYALAKQAGHIPPRSKPDPLR